MIDVALVLVGMVPRIETLGPVGTVRVNGHVCEDLLAILEALELEDGGFLHAHWGGRAGVDESYVGLESLLLLFVVGELREQDGLAVMAERVVLHSLNGPTMTCELRAADIATAIVLVVGMGVMCGGDLEDGLYADRV